MASPLQPQPEEKRARDAEPLQGLDGMGSSSDSADAVANALTEFRIRLEGSGCGGSRQESKEIPPVANHDPIAQRMDVVAAEQAKQNERQNALEECIGVLLAEVQRRREVEEAMEKKQTALEIEISALRNLVDSQSTELQQRFNQTEQTTADKLLRQKREIAEAHRIELQKISSQYSEALQAAVQKELREQQEEQEGLEMHASRQEHELASTEGNISPPAEPQLVWRERAPSDRCNQAHPPLMDGPAWLAQRVSDATTEQAPEQEPEQELHHPQAEDEEQEEEEETVTEPESEQQRHQQDHAQPCQIQREVQPQGPWQQQIQQVADVDGGGEVSELRQRLLAAEKSAQAAAAKHQEAIQELFYLRGAHIATCENLESSEQQAFDLKQDLFLAEEAAHAAGHDTIMHQIPDDGQRAKERLFAAEVAASITAVQKRVRLDEEELMTLQSLQAHRDPASRFSQNCDVLRNMKFAGKSCSDYEAERGLDGLRHRAMHRDPSHGAGLKSPRDQGSAPHLETVLDQQRSASKPTRGAQEMAMRLLSAENANKDAQAMSRRLLAADKMHESEAKKAWLDRGDLGDISAASSPMKSPRVFRSASKTEEFLRVPVDDELQSCGADRPIQGRGMQQGYDGSVEMAPSDGAVSRESLSPRGRQTESSPTLVSAYRRGTGAHLQQPSFGAHMFSARALGGNQHSRGGRNNQSPPSQTVRPHSKDGGRKVPMIALGVRRVDSQTNCRRPLSSRFP